MGEMMIVLSSQVAQAQLLSHASFPDITATAP